MRANRGENKVKLIIENCKQQDDNVTNAGLLWDMLKSQIGFTISYTTVVLKCTLNQDLWNQLKALEKNLNEDNNQD